LNQGDINENYFHFKLKHLLKVPEDLPFQKVQISISVFINDAKLLVNQIVGKSKNLNENEAEKKNIQKAGIMLSIRKKIRNRFFFYECPRT